MFAFIMHHALHIFIYLYIYMYLLFVFICMYIIYYSTLANPTQVNEIQRITCASASGSFTLSFRGETTTPIPYDASSLVLKNRLEALKTITNVKISMFGTQACMEAGYTITIYRERKYINFI